ncbi:MAG: GNAT family N-acetyltransferase [Burkholderiales bacterium]
MTSSSSAIDVQIRLLTWELAQSQAMPIREVVFVQEQGVPIEIEMDEFDPVCVHAIAMIGTGEAIGTGRLLPDGHIGRVAVLKAWRGKGVGATLLETLVRRAIDQGFEHAMLNAQSHAKAFYEKAGFVVEGDTFMEAGIPHVAMRRTLRS